MKEKKLKVWDYRNPALIFFDVFSFLQPFNSASNCRITHFIFVHNIFIENNLIVVQNEIFINYLCKNVRKCNHSFFFSSRSIKNRAIFQIEIYCKVLKKRSQLISRISPIIRRDSLISRISPIIRRDLLLCPRLANNCALAQC